MNIITRSLIVCLVTATTACGGGLVRGQPPLVGVSSLEALQSEYQTRVDIYNPNGVDMVLDSIEMSMILGETNLGRHSAPLDLTVHPNGTEEIGFAFPAQSESGRTLAELERREINSVSYTIEGRVVSPDGGSEQFSQDGYLYPIPGRPGAFRGAGPQRDR